MWALTKLGSRERALSQSYNNVRTKHKKSRLLFWGGRGVRDLDCVGEGGEFDVCGGTIGIPSGIVWRAFSCFGISFDCTGEIRRFEECISFFSCFFCFSLINVRHPLVFAFRFLCITKFAEDLGRTMFRQTTLEILNRLIILPQFDITCPDPAECPTHTHQYANQTIVFQGAWRGDFAMSLKSARISLPSSTAFCASSMLF
jgi:hypothetical protein